MASQTYTNNTPITQPVLPKTWNVKKHVRPYAFEEFVLLNMSTETDYRYMRCEPCIFWQSYGVCLCCDIVDDNLYQIRLSATARGDKDLVDAALAEMEKRSGKGLRRHPCSNYDNKQECPFCGCDLPLDLCAECKHLYNTGRCDDPAMVRGVAWEYCQLCGDALWTDVDAQ